MFYLDIDEIDSVAQKLKLFSRNKWNIFSFRDSDHVEEVKEGKVVKQSIRENITQYVAQHGVDISGAQIRLVTHVRMLGYIFNPVSFYYCYNQQNEPICAVVEVCNTFHEMKLYFIPQENLKDRKFHLHTTKYFYVSPFIDLDTSFDFNLGLPDDKLHVRIDDIDKDGKRFFISTLSGIKKKLSDANLAWYVLRFPFITLQVIFFIHWQALKLWLKKLPFNKKDANMHLQRDVLKPYNK